MNKSTLKWIMIATIAILILLVTSGCTDTQYVEDSYVEPEPLSITEYFPTPEVTPEATPLPTPDEGILSQDTEDGICELLVDIAVAADKISDTFDEELIEDFDEEEFLESYDEIKELEADLLNELEEDYGE